MLEPRHILDVKKQQIENNLQGLFDLVHRAINDAMACLDGADKKLCRTVIDRDPELNETRRLLEQDCLVALASQQPVAHDLRDIVACMRVAAELERIGDYAGDIAAGVLQMDGNDLSRLGLPDLVDMAAICTDMLSKAAEAIARRDAALARDTAILDDRVDAAQQKLVQDLFANMQSDPALVPDASRMLWIAHNLERCGDRITNICEQVVFMIRGEDVELN